MKQIRTIILNRVEILIMYKTGQRYPYMKTKDQTTSLIFNKILRKTI